MYSCLSFVNASFSLVKRQLCIFKHVCKIFLQIISFPACLWGFMDYDIDFHKLLITNEKFIWFFLMFGSISFNKLLKMKKHPWWKNIGDDGRWTERTNSFLSMKWKYGKEFPEICIPKNKNYKSRILSNNLKVSKILGF